MFDYKPKKKPSKPEKPKKTQKNEKFEERINGVTPEMKKQCEALVGKTEEKLIEIDIHHVFDNKYRVDAWVEHWSFEHQVYPGNRIEKSFFVKFEDEKLVDLTEGSLNGKWPEISKNFSKKK